MSNQYNIFYDNRTGRVVLNKTKEVFKKDEEFDKKIEELYKFTNLNSPNKISIDRKVEDRSFLNNSKKDYKETFENINSKKNYNDSFQKKEPFENMNELFENNYKQNVSNINEKFEKDFKQNILNINEKFEKDYKQNILNINEKIEKDKDFKQPTVNQNQTLYKKDLEKNSDLKEIIIKKDLVYGIKKTILSDFNYLNNSSNNNDFIIGLNKNTNRDEFLFDSFYLFPNICEINSKNETNIINEKIINTFYNINNRIDIQYFPIDFVPCGINIPLKLKNSSIKKIIIKNIYWNIFQSISTNNYNGNELLSIVPNKNDFLYKKINLQVNFELHSQVSKDSILPYKNLNIRNVTPANSCLYDVLSIKINTLNGSYFNNLEINLIPDYDIQCALICIRISVPNDTKDILRGFDKNNIPSYGNIPFSQFIINFDYELVID